MVLWQTKHILNCTEDSQLEWRTQCTAKENRDLKYTDTYRKSIEHLEYGSVESLRNYT